MNAGNRDITRGAVPFGNFVAMAKADWQELDGGWERLKWSRMTRSPFETAEAAAESLGMKAGTYRAYERPPHASKHIAVDHQAAAKFGRKFKVNWIWLLTGEGTPDTPDITPAQERMLNATRGASAEEQARAADVVEAMLNKGAA